MKGTVILYDSQQGHGFILPDESGKDVFVHQNGLIDEIKEGDVVEFELAEGKKGLNAVNVKLATSFSEGTDQGRRF
ncbi:MAG: cold-shock protein [Bacteroidetes bacterium]|nr:cold shock domain-containing protein [Bacteroidia bacterium]PCH69074.1 MAG: cold-shock protein [Bacteroidota bacterium]